MGYNDVYWKDKKLNMDKAADHNQRMLKVYPTEISRSIQATELWTDDRVLFENISKKEAVKSNMIVENMDTVSAIFKYSADQRVMVLNFASYKHPGGGFMSGSSAQEESLCHESTLYQILSNEKFAHYYAYNNQHKNKSLYMNRALYSPEVIFTRDNKCTIADVITCAAPNYRSFSMYNSGSEFTNSVVLESRIYFIATIARYYRDKGIKTIILGAFGCGVFGQHPKKVAELFRQAFLNAGMNVIFAVIDKGGHTREGAYNIFKQVIEGQDR